MDEYGEAIYPDLLFHYQVDLIDTVRGTGRSPAELILLIKRLPDTSAYRALQRGGWEHFGWGQERHMLADIYDALAYQTEVTGNWVDPKKVSLPRWPRPKAKKRETGEKKPISVRDLWQKTRLAQALNSTKG